MILNGDMIKDKKIEQIYQMFWSKQKEIIDRATTSSKISVRAGFGLGKTFMVQFLALSNLINGRNISIVSPTHRQLIRLRAEIQHLGDLFGIKIDPGSLKGYSEYDTEKKYNPSSADNESVFLVDEYPGDLSFLKEIENASIFIIGSPTRQVGFLYQTQNKEELGFEKFQISCLGSPNVEVNENGDVINKNPLPYPMLVCANWINKMGTRYGKDSEVYRNKVLGEF
jgi:hypothetical protein